MKIIGLILIMALCIMPVSAQTLSFIDTTSLDEDSGLSSTEVYVYYGNGTLAGTMNSTSELTGVNSSQDLVFILKPNTLTLFNNPDWVIGWAVDNWTLIFVFVFALFFSAAAVVIATAMAKGLMRPGRR